MGEEACDELRDAISEAMCMQIEIYDAPCTLEDRPGSCSACQAATDLILSIIDAHRAALAARGGEQ